MDLISDIIDLMLRDAMPQLRGKAGEAEAQWNLIFLKMFGKKGKILKNLYLPNDRGGTTEIDLIFITRKGIFVIESKNYSGWIFGNSRQQYWTQSLSKNNKNRFFNPVIQNQVHIKWLRHFLNEFPALPMFSLIVFSDRCELKNVTNCETDVFILQMSELYAQMDALWWQKPDVLTQEQVALIHKMLRPLTRADKQTKQDHIDDIKQRYHKEEPQPEPEEAPQPEPEEAPQPEPTETAQPEPLLCPRCGRPLVLRTARRGQYTGSAFYGCSGFPKCRYMRQAESAETPQAEPTEPTETAQPEPEDHTEIIHFQTTETPQPEPKDHTEIIHFGTTETPQPEPKDHTEIIHFEATETPQPEPKGHTEIIHFETTETPLPEPTETTQPEPLLCPRCGRPLVLRTARRGQYAGSAFYGCSGFPKCWYTLGAEA